MVQGLGYLLVLLKVGVVASTDDEAARLVDGLARRGARVLPDDAIGDPVEESILVGRLSEGLEGSFHFVVGAGRADDPGRHRADLWTDAMASNDRLAVILDDLWAQRLVVFERNLRSGQRAPRKQRAVVMDPNPDWPYVARRLINRLAVALGEQAIRIDHIGSTAVPGLPAKDLIDIQVVVTGLDVAAEAARAASAAGFVHVPGSWSGADRVGELHPEEVSVDADPGRPVNVNIRPITSPVWHDTLLLRDWLRQDADGRTEYAALKRELAARDDLDVNVYGERKMPWIRSALKAADDWARHRDWTP